MKEKNHGSEEGDKKAQQGQKALQHQDAYKLPH